MVLTAALLAGCGNNGGDSALPTGTTTTGSGTAPRGIVLAGTVPNVSGARVDAYHVQPTGTIGEPQDPLSPAPSYPLPDPRPIASTSLDSSGNFRLELPDARPVVVYVTGGQFSLSQVSIPLETFVFQAAVPTPGTSTATVTAFTTMASRLALASMQDGTDAQSAITSANAAMAAYLNLPELLSGLSPRYATALSALYEQARIYELAPLDMVGALGDDATDGTFDGLQAGLPVPVTNLSDTQVPLPPTLMTSGAVAARGTANKSSGSIAPPPAHYESPYSLNFTAPGLTDDFSKAPRSDLSFQSHNPFFEDWYKLSYWKDTTNAGIISERDFGPTSNLYPAPTVPTNLPAGMTAAIWRQQRVLATAYSNHKLNYQHHHIPGWNPPRNWPYWKSVAEGHITAGLDCSNFSSWNYNFGLGLKLDGAPLNQGQQTSVTNSNGTFKAVTVLAQTNPKPGDNPIPYQTFKSTLQTGDLLYIRGEPTDPPGTKITHVIMWVGSIGQGSGDVPLVIDSHGPVVIDKNGKTIPNGVYLRPFYDAANKPQGTGQDWYLAAFDHANRWVADDK